MNSHSLSREERALYNPAFTAVLCARAVQGYWKEYNAPCPIPVAIVAPIMALQPSIRKVLPSTTNAGIMQWIDRNKVVKISMALNTAALASIVRPGLLFTLQSQVLRCEENGLTLQPRTISKKVNGDTELSIVVQKSAVYLGRWIPSTGSLSTVLTLLGVKP